MSGIFGFTGFTLHCDNPDEVLRRMGEVQEHRGPDGEDYFIDQGIGMGIRILDNVDTWQPAQAGSVERNRIIAFCDGTIYNYNEMKADLSKKGYTFTTTNHSELTSFLYDEYGIDLVYRLIGAYAISIYDQRSDKLFLIRDRLGTKPLYYANVNGSIIYSSELKSILLFDTIDRNINFDALSTYLDLMYIPKPMTPFKGISKLGSSSYLVWENKGLKIQKYWDPSLGNSEKTEQEYIGAVENLLERSIKSQVRSDVSIGSFLSGGIDSSFVTAVASKLTEREIPVYHLRWKALQGKIDESLLANSVADSCNANKTFRNVDDIDVLSLIPKLIYYLEEPCGDAAFIPTYFLANIASEKVKVILSGAGGDELFGGYSRYREYSILKSILGKMIYGRGKAFSYFDICKTGHQRYWKKNFPWYTPDFFKSTFEKKFVENRSVDKYNAMMLNDISYYLQDDILFLTDKMTMAASIECRVPLLDHRIVELSCSMPSSLKIKDGERKYLFKKIAEKYLPRDVIYRKKEGFGFPIEGWINEYKELYFDILLERGFLLRNRLIKENILKRFFLKTRLNKEQSWLYWQILVLEIWFQLFVEEKPYENIFDL